MNRVLDAATLISPTIDNYLGNALGLTGSGIFIMIVILPWWEFESHSGEILFSIPPKIYYQTPVKRLFLRQESIAAQKYENVVRGKRYQVKISLSSETKIRSYSREIRHALIISLKKSEQENQNGSYSPSIWPWKNNNEIALAERILQ